jgi:hypothetical protein
MFWENLAAATGFHEPRPPFRPVRVPRPAQGLLNAPSPDMTRQGCPIFTILPFTNVKTHAFFSVRFRLNVL